MSDDKDDDTYGSGELSEVEVALVDAQKTAIEIILQAIPGSEKFLERAFAFQRDQKIQSIQPTGAAVFEMLRLFVVDPSRRANREEIRKFLEEEPKGEA